jgi:undecaprenyl pyrophosphate synthase
MVVGGSLRDWADLGDARWSERVDVLGRTAGAGGASWLTLRPYENGPDDVELKPWTRTVEVPAANGEHRTVDVCVDPCGDGRARFAEAMERLAPTDDVTEATVAAALYEPADVEPDLVLVLGPSTQLPPSLVWELAYAELVFMPVPWDLLGPDHLVAAIADFSGRSRRFGGLDE